MQYRKELLTYFREIKRLPKGAKVPGTGIEPVQPFRATGF
jgi:hypothetical protein